MAALICPGGLHSAAPRRSPSIRSSIARWDSGYLLGTDCLAIPRRSSGPPHPVAPSIASELPATTANWQKAMPVMCWSSAPVVRCRTSPYGFDVYNNLRRMFWFNRKLLKTGVILLAYLLMCVSFKTNCVCRYQISLIKMK